MKVSDLIDNHIRVLIGDGKVAYTDVQTSVQPHKYDTAFLITLMNECMLEIAIDTIFLTKVGVALLTPDSKRFQLPNDFLGLVGSDDASLGSAVSADTNINYPNIHLIPTHRGMELERPLSAQELSTLSQGFADVVLPATSDIIGNLISSGQITPDDRLLVGIPPNSVFISFEYRYVPPLLDENTDLTALGHRGLQYALTWGVSSKALLGDLSNEALNVANIYHNKYNKLKDNLAVSYHEWNNISLVDIITKKGT